MKDGDEIIITENWNQVKKGEKYTIWSMVSDHKNPQNLKIYKKGCNHDDGYNIPRNICQLNKKQLYKIY